MNINSKRYNFWTIFLIVFGILSLVFFTGCGSNKIYADTSTHDIGVWCASSGPGYGSWTVHNTSNQNINVVLVSGDQPPLFFSLSPGNAQENINMKVDFVKATVTFADGTKLNKTAYGDCTFDSVDALEVLPVDMPEVTVDDSYSDNYFENSEFEASELNESFSKNTSVQNAVDTTSVIYELPATGPDHIVVMAVIAAVLILVGLTLQKVLL